MRSAAHRKRASLENALGSVGYGGEPSFITGPGVPAEMRCRDLEFIAVMARRGIHKVSLAHPWSFW